MGLLRTAATFLFGGSAAAEKVATVVDKAVHTSQEKAGESAADLESARGFAVVSNQPGLINQLADAANRLIRPGVTAWLLGGFAGWWALPKPGVVDPYWQSVFYLVLTFWFGGRMLLKDLPSAIKALRGK